MCGFAELGDENGDPCSLVRYHLLFANSCYFHVEIWECKGELFYWNEICIFFILGGMEDQSFVNTDTNINLSPQKKSFQISNSVWLYSIFAEI